MRGSFVARAVACGVVMCMLGGQGKAADALPLMEQVERFYAAAGTPHDEILFHKELFAAGVETIKDFDWISELLQYDAPSDKAPLLRALIEAGADVNGCGEDEESPLHLCALDTDISPEIVDMLLAAGADVNAKDRYREDATPLRIAVSVLNTAMCRRLVAAGADVTVKSSAGGSLLHAAIDDPLPGECGCCGEQSVDPAHGERLAELCLFLVEKGVDVNSRDEFQCTPLHLALKSPALVKALLSVGAEVDARDGKGSTSLARAVRLGNVESCRLLLQAGADANAVDQKGETPKMYAERSRQGEIVRLFRGEAEPISLHTAMVMNDLEAVKKALAAGAKVGGECSVAEAVSLNCSPEIMEALLQAGADVNEVDAQGATALELVLSVADYFGYERNSGSDARAMWIDRLLRAGAKPSAECLMQGMGEGDVELCKRLLQAGAPVEPAMLAATDSPELCRMLLEMGVDANVIAPSGLSALQCAVHTAAAEKCRMLLAAGANPNLVAVGSAPLVMAAGKHHVEICRMLLEAGADVEGNVTSVPHEKTAGAPTPPIPGSPQTKVFIVRADSSVARALIGGLVRKPRKVSPLREAVRTAGTPLERAEVCRLLLQAGARVDTEESLLDVAIAQEDAETCKLLLEAGAKVENDVKRLRLIDWAPKELCDLLDVEGACRRFGWSPLHLAVYRGAAKEVERLLAEGAQVNARNSKGETPLHFAAEKGDLAACRALLAAGADRYAPDNGGNTPLIVAVREERPEVCRLLAEKAEAAAQHATYLGEALCIALTSSQQAVSKLLLDAGADVNAREDGGATPLICWASQKGCVGIGRLLLRAGADVNAADEEGNTALHFLALHQKISACRLLLSAGADVTIRNHEGQTPADRAKHWDDYKRKLLELLTPKMPRNKSADGR